jgi:hypothetical protein
MRRLLQILVGVQFVLLVLGSSAWAQGRKYEGPEDEAGDIAAEREGYMTGNRVFLFFRNTTELSDWPRVDVSKWPNTFEGTKMLDGVALLIGARVFIANDTIPVTDPHEIQTRRDLDTLYFCQTSYREEMDRDPTGTVEWGLYPCFGYFNEASDYPAMSNLPSSWPPEGWPAQGRSLKWPGEWNGRFGRGVIYADLETYFVANDAQDQEYLGPEDRVRYYPRPGVRIGDILPHKITIQKGKPWGGIGIRVEVRGFQWNNPQARDAIFWEYNISNISNYDLPQIAFGYWVDNAIGDMVPGAGEDDDLGFFDRRQDMAYSWDINGIGQGGFPTGVMGFAYLESPGLPFDGIDNDEDGLIDEKRDNAAQHLIGPTDGIANLNNFLSFYNLRLEDLHPHWDADEDQDWQDGRDLNGNGIYEPWLGEDAGDDVGLDGVGPLELNYNGPDEGECNHKPDYVEGRGCEPNFAATDVSESDMVGLTAFMMFPVPSHASEYHWFRGDKSMWEVLGQDTLIEYLGRISNLIETFASGPFPLYKGRTERISMALLHAYDPLSGLNSESHSAPALFRLKQIAQVIYERDYRFAMPPKMPTLKATAGDGYVILTWDDVADTKTRDPFMGNINDFEGYKLFRATDKKMADAEVITDGFGTPMFKKPIFQCDVIDGRSGFTNYGLVNGMGYYLGNETGIVHYFIDRDVQNGRTYYYALVAYDYGAPDIGPGVAPSENNVVIELDEDENIRRIGQNVQIVVPHQMAAGYQPPTLRSDSTHVTIGSGKVKPEILARGDLKFGHTYEVRFLVDTLETVPGCPWGLRYLNNGFAVYDVTDSNRLVYKESPERFAFTNITYNDSLDVWYIPPGKEIQSDIFEGLRLRIQIPVLTAEFDALHSGWVKGSSPMLVLPSSTEAVKFPWDYDIIFTDNDSAYVGRVTTKTMRDERGVRLDRTVLLTGQKFNFRVENRSVRDADGRPVLMDLVVHDRNRNGQFDMIGDRVLVGAVTTDNRWAGTVFVLDFSPAGDPSRLPKPGDVYRVSFRRPFFVTDAYRFTVNEESGLDRKGLREAMDRIKVVPNPYVATNAMEPSVASYQKSQRRRLMFTHIPAKCTIKIFTVSGTLVDEIHVDNPSDEGIVHWDLQTKEGLEVAAGMYIFYVKSDVTGDVKMGKFAIIK